MFFIFNKTALHIAISKNNIDLVKLLLSYKDIDVNIPYILYSNYDKILNNLLLNIFQFLYFIKFFLIIYFTMFIIKKF